MDVEDPIRDEKKAEDLSLDANTTVEKNVNERECDNGPTVEPDGDLGLDEYPKGLQFIFILLALILSVFMVALDLVCFAPVLWQTYANPIGRPLSQRLSQRLRMSFIVFLR